MSAAPVSLTLAQWSEGWRPWGLLLLLCLGLYLPGLAAIPPLDRDEARFAQATRQMLESGDYLRIRFQDEARNKKPAGIYWLQAAAAGLLSDPASDAIWPYRLPSVLGAILAVLGTFGFGARLVGRGAALLGAALLASSLGLVAEAHLAKTDAVLLATVVAAQSALGEAYCRGRDGAPLARRWVVLFWTAQGIGILIKGPITPLLSLLTVLALGVADRRWSWLRGLRPAWGVPLLLAIAAPWLVLILMATGGAFAREALGHDLIGKLIGGQEGHGAPPGYYLLLAVVTFWPASLFLGRAAYRGWRERRAPAERFLLAWGVPFWLLLEAVPTKLPHYILPAYPALALLAGQALTAPPLASGAAAGRGWLVLQILVPVLWGLAALGFAVLLFLAPLGLGEGPDLAGIVAALVLLLLGTKALARYRTPGPSLAVRLVVLALLVVAPSLGLVAPRLDRLWLSRDAATMVARHEPPPGIPILAVGYSEPSLVFLLGTRTRLASPETAAAAIAATAGAVALVSDREDAAFRQALAARGLTPRALDHVAGLDYSNGHRLVLTLYAGAPV